MPNVAEYSRSRRGKEQTPDKFSVVAVLRVAELFSLQDHTLLEWFNGAIRPRPSEGNRLLRQVRRRLSDESH
jgi:hypothetical protein